MISPYEPCGFRRWRAHSTKSSIVDGHAAAGVTMACHKKNGALAQMGQKRTLHVVRLELGVYRAKEFKEL
jgi:hypothetical protein